ncbi:GAF domain-containing protein [Kribbella sp. CA-294648]|uniref:GAF domain-containing protein n=1 Tax=Kribbella sp. CA-294648 TaxID=3239948 RepID=UPI003D8AD155
MHGQQAREFAAAAGRLEGQVEVGEIFATLEELARVGLHCEHVGLLLCRDDRLTEVGATDPAVEQADRWQLDTGEGPCCACLETPGACVVADTTTEDRWPGWSTRVARFGFRASAAIPLREGEVTLGVLTLYSDRPATFDAAAQPCADLLAAHATRALARSGLN